MASTPDQAMIIQDVASYLNIDEKTVYRLTKRRVLLGFKVAGVCRFKRSVLDSWFDQQEKAVQSNRLREVGAK